MRGYSLSRSSPPAVAALVSVNEIKANLRYTLDDQDDLFGELRDEAYSLIDHSTSYAPLAGTYALKIHGPIEGSPWHKCDRGFEYIEVPKSPLSSVTSIAYLDVDGNSQTWSSANYEVDTASLPGRIWLVYGATWPSVRDVQNAVTVTFVAGNSAATADDDRLKRTKALIKGLVIEWYKQPETRGTIPETIKNGFASAASAIDVVHYL